MADLTTLLSKFLTSLYAGVMDAGVSTLTLGSATSVTSVAVGTGTTTALVDGTLASVVTATATTGTIEETLASYTLPANTLAVNGRGVRITVGAFSVANANVKTLKLYFGGTVIGNSSFAIAAPNGSPINIIAMVYRTAATTQRADGVLNASSVGSFVSGAPGETLSGTVLIKVTGTTPTTIGDLTVNSFLVEAI